MARYDVAIVGAGPAGCAAALALKKLDADLRIALIAAPPVRKWSIGETLAPGVQHLLASLGCWEDVLSTKPIEACYSAAAWNTAAVYENDFLFSTRGNAWHVDRNAFDAALVRAAERSGVHVRRNVRLLNASAHTGRDGMHWKLMLGKQRALSGAITATVAIDASGRSAVFARRAGARLRRDDRLVAAAVRGRAESGMRCGSLVESGSNGWWYCAAVPGGRAVTAFFTDADMLHAANLREAERWLEALAQTQHVRARLANVQWEWPLCVWPAGSQRLDVPGGRNWIAIGDAAAAFDPLSSAGILKALVDGKRGAFAALDMLHGRTLGLARLSALLEREYSAYLAARSTMYSAERRWCDSRFWMRRSPMHG